MGKIKTHRILFDVGYSATFYAGSEIKGHVFIQLEESLTTRGIRILFRGHAKVGLSKKPDDVLLFERGSRRKPIAGHSTEEYFKTSFVLHGFLPGQGNPTVELQAGDYKFPFSVTLPRNIPGSFEGTYGYVRYYAESNIDMPWKLDPKATRDIIVIPIVDLNLDPRNRYGASAENEKDLCCLCCKSGPISATFKIEKQGFVPGEAIKLFAEINNDSNQSLLSHVELIRTIFYFGRGKSRTKTRRIVTVGLTRPAIRPHGKDVWTGQTLRVPVTPPTGFPYCSLLDMEYKLQLVVSSGILTPDLEIPIDINIGTIPLGHGQSLQPHPAAPHGNFDQSLMNCAAETYSSTAPSCNPTALPNFDEFASAPPDENEQVPQPLSYEEHPTAPPEECRRSNVFTDSKNKYQQL